MQPTLVAEWAGHSVQVLLRVYAKYIEGQDAQSRMLIENALGTSEQDKASGKREGHAEPDADPKDDDDAA